MTDQTTILQAEIQNPEALRLCFVDTPKAYFTDADDFDALVHDDWDDGYDTAGLYGVEKPHRLIHVMVSGPVQRANYEKAPETIIDGKMEWMNSTSIADEPVSIAAKTTLPEFVRLVQKAGGQVYIPATND